MSTPKKPEYRHIGKYRPRKDAREIVTGKCIYLDDFKMKDMLHAKLMPSPYAHAMIKDIDTSKAEALPGVYAVVTYKNQPEFSKEFLQGLPPVKKVCDQHLRYVGDCVALVAAESEELCEEAIRLIKVDYEVLPAVFDIEQAKADGAAQLYPGFFENNRYEKDLGFGDEKMLFAVERGDCDKACEEADYVYEGTGYFETNPAPLAPEPPEMIMYYDDINNKYLMWATAQSDRVPKMPPDVGRMPADAVIESRVFNVGGSYGNKQEMTLMCLYTALLSRLTGHPVRFRMNKEDQLTIHEMRLGSRFTARFSIKDGIMTSVKGHWYVMPGYTDDAGYCITAVGLGEMQVALAKCQNWDIDTCMYATNTISCGTVRGFGGQELKSAMMPVIDHMLADMNIDPVQFFHDNFVHAGDRYMWRDCNWWTCHEVDYRQAILEAAEKFGWKEKFKGWYKPTAVNGSKRIGVGVSIHGNGDVGEDNSEAIVRLHTNGSVILNQSLVESGQGQRAACAKMVAEVLNVPFESVTVTEHRHRRQPGRVRPLRQPRHPDLRHRRHPRRRGRPAPAAGHGRRRVPLLSHRDRDLRRLRLGQQQAREQAPLGRHHPVLHLHHRLRPLEGQLRAAQYVHQLRRNGSRRRDRRGQAAPRAHRHRRRPDNRPEGLRDAAAGVHRLRHGGHRHLRGDHLRLLHRPHHDQQPHRLQVASLQRIPAHRHGHQGEPAEHLPLQGYRRR